MQWWIQVLASTVLFNLFKMCEVLITDNFAFIHKSENFTWSYVEKSSLLPPFYGISCNKNILIFLRLGVANDGCFKVSGEDIQTATGLIWRTEHFLCSGLSRKLFFAITGLVRITSFQNHSKTVCWVDTGQQANIHTAACYSPLQRYGEKIEGRWEDLWTKMMIV